MEDLQKKLDSTYAEFLKSLHQDDMAVEDLAWANYMTARFEAVMYNKDHGTKITTTR